MGEVDPSKTQAHAGKLAQLLREVLHGAAPVTSEIGARIHRQVTDEWLEGLEKHASIVVGPFVDQIMQSEHMPDFISDLLDHAKVPKAQFGATIQQFFVYGVMFSLASTALQPFTQVVANDLWAANPTRPLDPSILATMAVRGIDPTTTSITSVPGSIFDIANKSGVSNQDMQALADAIGNPPAPDDLFEMIRRGLIDEDKLNTGLREGDTRDEWIPLFSKLRYVTLSPADMVRAAVQKQLDYDTASGLAAQLGLEPPGFVNDNPDWFKIAYDIAGRPPGPEEAGRMANRGIIPWTGQGADVTSFEQSIAESDLKTKWTDALRALQAYVPPPRMVGGLLKSASITADQAQTFWEMGGVPEQLAKAYVHQATTQETEQEKELAKGEITTALYDGIIDTTTALDLLGVLGYSGKTAEYIISITQMRREISAINSAVNAVQSLYVHYKLTATDAKNSLHELGIANDEATELLSIWNIRRAPETRLPTMDQLGKAVQYGVIDGATALAKAELLGYTPFDAWLVLGAISQGALQGVTKPQDTDTGVDV